MNNRLDKLEIIKNGNSGQPACFLFRLPERFITDNNYNTWFKIFGKYDGIICKALDEELYSKNRDIDKILNFYNRYKVENPEKMLVLHYNGNEREPYDTDGRYFPGHWLYYRSCKILTDVPAEEGSTTIKVENTDLFKVNCGRFSNRNEDILLVAKGRDGRPDWYVSEEVILESTDNDSGTITVKRGQHRTKPITFKAGEAYALPHLFGGPWGKDCNLLWYYNLSTECPRDRNGKKALDLLAEEIAEIFGEGGKCEKFDGLEFDVAFTEFYKYEDYHRGVDTDGDLLPDGGFIDGRNKFAEGYIEFLLKLRKLLGNDRLIMADGNLPCQQRAIGILNGIESEGFSDKIFRDFEWSWGINRHKFWQENAYGVPFTYLNHRYKVEKKDRMNIDRIAFAASLFTDTYLSAVSLPFSRTPEELEVDGLPIWDEWVAGAEQRFGWLGTPLENAVKIARQERNLLEDISFCNDVSFLFPTADTYTGAEYPDANYGYAPYLQVSNENTVYINFDIPAGIGKDTKVLLQFHVMNVTLAGPPNTNIKLFKSDNAIWDEKQLTFISSDNLELNNTGRSVEVDNKIWKKFLTFDVTGLLPEKGGSITFCLKTDGKKRITLSSREGDATPKIVIYNNKEDNWAAAAIAAANNDTAADVAENDDSNGAYDGVKIESQNGNIIARILKGSKYLSRHILFSTDWFRCEGKDLTVYAILNAKGGTPLEDRARLVQVRVVDLNGKSYGNIMSWANSKDFEAGFYFYDIIPGIDIRLEFEIEGIGEIEFKNLSAYAFPDIIYREYEGGIIIANPSQIAEFTFDLGKHLPGKNFRRIKATINQDPEVNTGKPVEDGEIAISTYDAVFLIRDM